MAETQHHQSGHDRTEIYGHPGMAAGLSASSVQNLALESTDVCKMIHVKDKTQCISKWSRYFFGAKSQLVGS